MGGSGLTRFALAAKKSSFAASARPPTPLDANSARPEKDGLLCSVMLTHTAYGKSRVRLVQVGRHGDRHDLRDLDIAIRFEGSYDASYVEGDNRDVLPTDTMKNAVYALAAKQQVRDPEPFAMRLADHFLERNPLLARVTIDVVEHQWRRIEIGEREHGQAFMRRGPDTRTARIQGGRDGSRIEAGIDGLLIMKTGRSAFAGFPRDEFTTLPETHDRLLATALTATWRYAENDVPFGSTWRSVRDSLLQAFAEHDSASVQHTLYAMGHQVLAAMEMIESITLIMPNKHHLPVDLSRFGLENRNEVFVATDEPYGRIEATLTR
jgi:urate oxidase